MSPDAQSVYSTRTLLLITVMALSASACSSSKITLDPTKSVHAAVDAATGPLEDLNIKQHEIPPILIKAAMEPYALPAKATCIRIREELAQLDEVLGPDIKAAGVEVASNDDLFTTVSNVDEIELPETEDVADSGISFAGNFVMDTIRSHTNILPFRSIVRYVTGAEGHQRKLENAYAAGKLRRAYLKGVAQTRFGKRCKIDQPLVKPDPAVSA